jgi:hypothetical protein
VRSPMIPRGAGGTARYELRVAGRLGPALRLAFPGLTAMDEPAHSVIVSAQECSELSVLLDDLRRRGIRVVRIHLRRRDT